MCFIDDDPAANGRFYFDQNKNVFIIGRIAVLKKYRNCHIGEKLMKEIEKEISKLGNFDIELAAQVQAIPFYEKCGYTKVGETFLDEYCPHQMMLKKCLVLEKNKILF